MNQSVSVETILVLTEQLSTVDKVRLIERIAPQIQQELTASPKKAPKSLRGLWRGVNISADEIDQARKELWGNFPREDFE